MIVTGLNYGNTNTYLINANGKYILFDTDWAGTFEHFCSAIKEKGIKVQDIMYLFISHFHPDHMGIAEQIAQCGVQIVVCDVQREYIHCSDKIFVKDVNKKFVPINDANVILLDINQSRAFLENVGVKGEIIYTPGHSVDSISMWLDNGSLLVGDLNPLYELELHKGTQIGDTWEALLKRKPKYIFYGHAKAAVLNNGIGDGVSSDRTGDKMYHLVSIIMKYIDKHYSLDKIQKKTGADRLFIEDVMRMYLTHQNVGVQGILDRIEIKNR